MEIVKDNDVIQVKNFLSGSEIGIISYEQKKKGLSLININDVYQKSSPISVLVTSTQLKLQRILEDVFADGNPSIVSPFNIVYNITECSDDEINFGDQNYVAILPVARAVQVKSSQEEVMVDAATLLIAPNNEISIQRDKNDAVSLIVVAHINID